jgi:hypothetical protein
LDLENLVIVALIVAAWVFLGWADERDLFANAFFRMRIRLRRQLPAGRYVWEGANSVAVGKPDSVVVFKMPLQLPGEQRPRVHVAVTDSSTRFGVGDDAVAVDPFLEAYDAELGPLVVQVYEPGRIAEIGIDTGDHKAGASLSEGEL